MANIIVALVTLAISTVLVSFGAYQGYYSMKRTEYTTRVNGSVSRLATYVRASEDDLGRIPTASDIPATRISSESTLSKVNMSVGNTSSYAYVCAQAPNSAWMVESMQRVQAQWQNSVWGSNCDSSAWDPTQANVAVTVRIS